MCHIQIWDVTKFIFLSLLSERWRTIASAESSALKDPCKSHCSEHSCSWPRPRWACVDSAGPTQVSPSMLPRREGEKREVEEGRRLWEDSLCSSVYFFHVVQPVTELACRRWWLIHTLRSGAWNERGEQKGKALGLMIALPAHISNTISYKSGSKWFHLRWSLASPERTHMHIISYDIAYALIAIYCTLNTRWRTISLEIRN